MEFNAQNYLHMWGENWEAKQEKVRQPRDKQMQEASISSKAGGM